MGSFDLLFGGIAPNRRLASGMIGLDIGFQFGSLITGAYEQGSLLDKKTQILDQEYELFKLGNQFKDAKLRYFYAEGGRQADFKVAQQENTLATAGLVTNAGTAAQTLQNTRQMLLRNAILQHIV